MAVFYLWLTAVIATAGPCIALSPKIGNAVVGEQTDDPVGRHFGAGKVSIKQVRNPGYEFNGALSILKTHLKYGVQPPDHLVKAVLATAEGVNIERRSTGSTPTIPIDDMDTAYITPVTIGTPPQTLYINFDSGSSDLWVFSSYLPASQRRGQTVYEPGKSTSARQLAGHTWSIKYGDGSASDGNVYTDTISVGGLTVANQSIGCAQRVSASFTRETQMDGLAGLGFTSLNTVRPQKQLTFFDNIKKTLDKPLFTVDLKRRAEGTYDFGYIDQKKYIGNITYTPVNSRQGHWEWTSTGFGVGEGNFSATPLTGIADTGTTLMYLPDSVVLAYYRQVPGARDDPRAGGITLPCNTTAPAFILGVGSARITIPAKYMAYAPASRGSTTCFGGLQRSALIGVNIFGDAALKAAFVVFDASDSPSIGWAAKNLG